MAEVQDAYQLSGDLEAQKMSANGSPPTWWTGERWCSLLQCGENGLPKKGSAKS